MLVASWMIMVFIWSLDLLQWIGALSLLLQAIVYKYKLAFHPKQIVATNPDAKLRQWDACFLLDNYNNDASATNNN